MEKLEKTEEKFDRRGKSMNINKIKNLPQYRDKTDEELEAIIESKKVSVSKSSLALEERIQEKINKFSDDYDLTDLKINDWAILRALIQAILALEDYEQVLYETRQNGIDPNNILVIDKLQKIMSDLRKDISNFQTDLNITRKHRKSDQETSVVAYIDSLKEKARKFYESRMSYIYCPKCSTLLMTAWSLYPESNNKIVLVCQQKDKNDNLCGEKVTITTKELIKNRGTNNRDVMPESLL